jgi:hypothetical protein
MAVDGSHAEGRFAEFLRVKSLKLAVETVWLRKTVLPLSTKHRYPLLSLYYTVVDRFSSR